MTKSTITIEVACPVSIVFAFTTDPNNTPKWLSLIEREWIEDDEVQVGTIYYQHVLIEGKIEMVQYMVTEYEKDRLFGLKRLGTDYNCLYTYRCSGNNKTTLLTYSEWQDSSEVVLDPLDNTTFEILRQLIERC